MFLAVNLRPEVLSSSARTRKMWFCPVRTWTYAQNDAIYRKNSGHPLQTVTNELACLHAYMGREKQPAFGTGWGQSWPRRLKSCSFTRTVTRIVPAGSEVRPVGGHRGPGFAETLFSAPSIP